MRSGWIGGIELPRPMIRSEVEDVLVRFTETYGGVITAVRWPHNPDLAYFIYKHPDHREYIEICSPAGVDGSPYLCSSRADSSLTLHYGGLAESVRETFTERLRIFFHSGEEAP
jgi:hypothetical protein